MPNYSKHMPVTDHLGNHFDSVLECCNVYDIPEFTFRNRYLKGWDIERILTQPIKRRNMGVVTDHLGRPFMSNIEKCEYYGIDYQIYETRRNTHHKTEKEALTNEVRPYKHEMDTPDGKHNESITKTARDNNLPRTTLISRLSNNFDSEELLSPKNARGYKRKSKYVSDHKSMKHHSYRAMCAYYDFPYQTFMSRFKKGWSIEKIFTTPVAGRKHHV